MRLDSIAAGVVVAASLGCGSTVVGVRADAGGGSDSSNTTQSDGATACTTTLTCPPGTVCDRSRGGCTTNAIACANHGDCGTGAYCASGTNSCAHAGTGTPCAGNENCSSGDTCVGGFCGCAGMSYGATSVPPNVLIVLDRSRSMNEEIRRGVTKWEVAKDAITALLARHGSSVRFGLAVFPGDRSSCSSGDCAAGGVLVDPGEGTAAAINSSLAALATCRGTPIAETMTALRGYRGLEDATRPNIALLITDGKATCDDPVPTVRDLRMETPEVRTFVVGFGTGVDAAELENMAREGGTARSGTPAYYQADDETSLLDSLNMIAGSVLSCSFALTTVPADPSMLFVYLDRMPVTRDTTNGYEYAGGTNQVTFHGTSCDRLRGGGTGNLTIVYGCGGVIF